MLPGPCGDHVKPAHLLFAGDDVQAPRRIDGELQLFVAGAADIQGRDVVHVRGKGCRCAVIVRLACAGVGFRFDLDARPGGELD